VSIAAEVGFLPRQSLNNAEKFDGKLAQITEFLAESDSPHCRRLSHRNRGIVRAVIITGGPTDFCLNFSPTVEKLNSALHSALETLLSATNAADAIVGFVGDEHDKNNNSALVQLWSRYGSDNTVREDTAGIVRVVILYLYVDKKILSVSKMIYGSVFLFVT
jgi:hypothetical protein